VWSVVDAIQFRVTVVSTRWGRRLPFDGPRVPINGFRGRRLRSAMPPECSLAARIAEALAAARRDQDFRSSRSTPGVWGLKWL
jgi:hypothetical protein